MSPNKPGIAASLCGLALLAACTTSVPGTAVPPSPVDGLFVSCTIPDDALAAAGLDPASESVGFVGEQFTHAKLCSWDGPWYNIGIFAMTDTIEQIRAHPRYTGFRDVAINRPDAVLFRMTYDPRDQYCFVGYTTQRGTILFLGIDHAVGQDHGDICAVVTEASQALDHHIPG